jgi:putative phosphoribosyl transferase
MAGNVSPGLLQEFVEIPAGWHLLGGILRVPPAAQGVVAFAHGSGSGRLSPRNQAVARALETHGFGTLLVDLLDPREAEDREKVFDIPLLADRVTRVLRWLADRPETASLRRGLFGASTGAAAALQAAAQTPELVDAVVSRGGRPDRAYDYLDQVRAPTLLIVGGHDDLVLQWNQTALALLNCPKELTVVPGAGHLFEEPGKLDEVARLAGRWFDRYLKGEGGSHVSQP